MSVHTLYRRYLYLRKSNINTEFTPYDVTYRGISNMAQTNLSTKQKTHSQNVVVTEG